jgi:hypothetical protein
LEGVKEIEGKRGVYVSTLVGKFFLLVFGNIAVVVLVILVVAKNPKSISVIP